jgi:protein involved in polysaccharide export with SLBB domain
MVETIADLLSTLPRRSLLLIALMAPAALLAQGAANSREKSFRVIGKVNHPGKFALRDRISVYDGIIIAGGFTHSADRKKITITRGGEQHTFDAADFIRGKNVEQNIPLEDGDVIEVP